MKTPAANLNNINPLFNITNYSNGFNSSGIVVKIADFGESFTEFSLLFTEFLLTIYSFVSISGMARYVFCLFFI